MTAILVFFAIFSGLVFVDYQFNDWESEALEENPLASHGTNRMGR